MGASLSHTGYLLALIGGVIIVLSGALHLLGATFDLIRVLEFLPVLIGAILGLISTTYKRPRR